MNCWFCNQFVENSMCQTQSCRNHYVVYIRRTNKLNILNELDELFRVQFKTTLYTNTTARDYIINYLPIQEQIEVVEQITPPLDPESECPSIPYEYKIVFKIHYDSLILTPQNAKSKLPTLLIFL